MNDDTFLFLLDDGEMDDGRGEWKDKISSQFDRLVAFASTELDKRRRSTEGASPRAGDTTTSCNTSPDSGIGHGEPLPPALSKMPRLFKTPPAKASPGRDSPPVLEAPHSAERLGIPRTPSPSSPVPNAPFSPAPLDGPYSPVNAALQGSGKDRPSSGTSVPLKYQRSESLSSQHFKKKFFHHRDQWNSTSAAPSSNNGHNPSHTNAAPSNPNTWQHKGKFRPKGKDWEWYGGSSSEGQPYRERDQREQRDQRDQRDHREHRDHRDHRRDQRDHRSYHQNLPHRYRAWEGYHENQNHPQGNF